MTAPAYGYAALAIETDNQTVKKIIEKFHKRFFELYVANEKFSYTMYTFKNFIY